MLKKLRSALVAGANGFIGSALVHRLATEDVRVTCLVRKGSSRRRLRNSPNVLVIEVAEYEPQILQTALSGLEVDVAFNLASAGVNPVEREPWGLIKGNVGVVVPLLVGLEGKKPWRFVHTGSCSEYATVLPGHNITEEDTVRPTSLYGAAKICASTYGAALAAQQDMAFVTVRLFGVFGTGEAPYRLVPYLIERLSSDQTVDLTPGEQVRDFLYVDDAVDALALAGSSESLECPGVYNVCSGEGVSVRHVAEEIAGIMEKSNKLLRFGERPYRPDDAMWIVGDPRRFKAATGWFPKVSIHEGLQRMVAQTK
jgi:UDP-glucose 4-epimerase